MRSRLPPRIVAIVLPIAFVFAGCGGASRPAVDAEAPARTPAEAAERLARAERAIDAMLGGERSPAVTPGSTPESEGAGNAAAGGGSQHGGLQVGPQRQPPDLSHKTAQRADPPQPPPPTDSPVATADRHSDGDTDDESGAEPRSTCDNACDALASMKRASDRLCALDPDQCQDARDRTSRAEARVRASCPECS